jgi:hypothetical protein
MCGINIFPDAVVKTLMKRRFYPLFKVKCDVCGKTGYTTYRVDGTLSPEIRLLA